MTPQEHAIDMMRRESWSEPRVQRMIETAVIEAIEEAREACAKLVEDLVVDVTRQGARDIWAQDYAEQAAAAIRAGGALCTCYHSTDRRDVLNHLASEAKR